MLPDDLPLLLKLERAFSLGAFAPFLHEARALVARLQGFTSGS